MSGRPPATPRRSTLAPPLSSRRGGAPTAAASPCWCATPSFRRVTLAAREHYDQLGELDADLGMSRDALASARSMHYHEQHEEILTDADARSSAMLSIDEADEQAAHVWHVHQIFADEDGDHDFGIMADVDLDATQDGRRGRLQKLPCRLYRGPAGLARLPPM